VRLKILRGDHPEVLQEEAEVRKNVGETIREMCPVSLSLAPASL
jgi:hypothetical protein